MKFLNFYFIIPNFHTPGNRCAKRNTKQKHTSPNFMSSMKSQKNGKFQKSSSPTREKSQSLEISPDTCLSKISFNMLNLNNNNDSSYQSVCSQDEINETGDDFNGYNEYANDEMNELNDEENNSYDGDQDDEYGVYG